MQAASAKDDEISTPFLKNVLLDERIEVDPILPSDPQHVKELKRCRDIIQEEVVLTTRDLVSGFNLF